MILSPSRSIADAFSITSITIKGGISIDFLLTIAFPFRGEMGNARPMEQPSSNRLTDQSQVRWKKVKRDIEDGHHALDQKRVSC
jgi:hypothetical protein